MKIDRLLGILNVLANTDRTTVQELAERFEVSKRTIFRDLDTLNESGVPIVTYSEIGGGVAVIEGYKLKSNILSKNDIKNVFTALNGLMSIDESFNCKAIEKIDFRKYLGTSLFSSQDPTSFFEVILEYDAANFMAENGYLYNIRHSGNTLEYMKSQAPHYKGDSNFIEKQAVCDSGIITANGTVSLEFAREIMLCLNVKSIEKIDEWYKFNKLGFYQK